MFQLRSPKNTLDGLGIQKTHAQKKYFSLMLVPSFSSGKTRSIRIPYTAFYAAIITVVAIAAIVLFFYLQTQFFRSQALEISGTLAETQATVEELQETESRLLEDTNNLRRTITETRLRGYEEQLRQSETYQEAIEAIHSYVEVLEEQIDRFEYYREEILNRLTSYARIPPVGNILGDMNTAQYTLLSDLEEVTASLEEFRNQPNLGDVGEGRSIIPLSAVAQPNITVDDVFEYIELLEARVAINTELFHNLNENSERMAPHIRNHPTIVPANGRTTSGFGWRRRPMGGGGGEMHQGIDIAAPSGTPIRATGAGTVTFSGWSGAYGNKVVIDHGFGIQTLYAHNSSNLVSVGQQVSRGETIARVGSTGRSTGPHVHYEVIVNGTPVNPSNFFID